MDPYAPPVSHADEAAPRAADYDASWDGKRLAFDMGARLPNVCLKCGKEEGVRRKLQTFQWVPPILYLLMLLGMLPFLVTYALVRRIAKPSLPFCAPCRERQQKGMLTVQVSVLVSALGLVAALALWFNDVRIAGAIVALAVVACSAYAIRLGNRSSVWPTHIGKRTITLGGVCDAAAKRIVARARPSSVGRDA